MNKTVTSEQLKTFFSKYAKSTGVKFVSKGFMSMVYSLLYRLAAKTAFGKFLPELPPSIRPCCLKNIVLLDFCIGDSNVPAIDQISTAVHEACHSIRIRKLVNDYSTKVSAWYRSYCMNDDFRAEEEGFANTAEAEVVYYMTGQYPTPICDYSSYLIFKQDAKDAFEHGCEKRMSEVKTLGPGYTTQEAAKSAIAVLQTL